ncbi:hypothetical protein SAMD00019534_110630, partial [Acytostelium subglobosum LB1]|uniref:hypothetical protein n=1 Tax=Acytostelium subglobosum LB1 TaxID=1410327 RepID=UPI000644D7C2
SSIIDQDKQPEVYQHQNQYQSQQNINNNINNNKHQKDRHPSKYHGKNYKNQGFNNNNNNNNNHQNNNQNNDNNQYRHNNYHNNNYNHHNNNNNNSSRNSSNHYYKWSKVSRPGDQEQEMTKGHSYPISSPPSSPFSPNCQTPEPLESTKATTLSTDDTAPEVTVQTTEIVPTSCDVESEGPITSSTEPDHVDAKTLDQVKLSNATTIVGIQDHDEVESMDIIATTPLPLPDTEALTQSLYEVTSISTPPAPSKAPKSKGSKKSGVAKVQSQQQPHQQQLALQSSAILQSANQMAYYQTPPNTTYYDPQMLMQYYPQYHCPHCVPMYMPTQTVYPPPPPPAPYMTPSQPYYGYYYERYVCPHLTSIYYLTCYNIGSNFRPPL